MIGPEMDEQMGRNSADYCNRLEALINSIEQTDHLEEKMNSLKLETATAKNTFQDETIDFLYGSVIRDAENALNQVQNEPGTRKSIKMLEYYSNHCPFILGLLKQEKASCTDVPNDDGVRNGESRFKQLQRAQDCLDKLAKCFAEIPSSCKK